MKRKTFSLLAIFFIVAAVNILMAQAPEKFKYQAVLRDASGNIIANSAQTVVVNLLQGSSGGTSVYQETHSVTTTPQGVINMEIGGGTVNAGTFTTINWSANTYYIKVTVGGTEISNGQLLSVPYSLSVKGMTYDPATGYIGIGNTTPSYKLDVNGEIHAGVDGGACFRVGNDATINDINFQNHIGIYGAYDPTVGSLKLGSGGPVLSGKSGFLGIGTTNPGSYIDVIGGANFTRLNLESSSTTLGPELRLNATGTGGSDWRIWSSQASNPSGAGNLEFWRSGTGTVMTMKANGRVGIGMLDPTNKLDVNGGGTFRGDLFIYAGSTDQNLKIGPGSCRSIGYAQNWATNCLYINGWGDWTGGVSIGHYNMATEQSNLYVNGEVWARGSGYWNQSDERLKTNISTIDNALGIVKQLRGVTYNWKSDGKPSFGFVAQELEAAFPMAVSQAPGADFKSVNYGLMVAVVAQAVKELNAKVEKLEKENGQLRAENHDMNTLRAEVDELKSMITSGKAIGNK